MERISLKSKLAIASLGIIMASLLLLTIVTYLQFNEVVETELMDTMSERTGESANHINTWLTSQLGEVRETVDSPIIDRVLSLNPQLDLTRKDESIKLIDELNRARGKYVAQAYPNQYAALHIISYLEPDEWSNPEKLGQLTARYYNVKDGTCKTNLWAKAAAEEAGERYSKTGGVYDAIFKPAYSQAYNRNMVLMLAWRKDNQGNVLAGAAASLTIETIQQIAQQANYGNKGYDLLLAQDGTFVTHPNSSWAMKEKTSSVNDKNMQELGRLAASGEPGVFHYSEGGEMKVAFYNPIPIAGWTLVTVVDDNELFAPANKLLVLMLTIIAIIVIFTLMSVYIVSLVVNLKRSNAAREELCLQNEAERKIYQAEISALQAQIQPHFLYNTLNTITAFCRTQPMKAAEILEELSNYLQGKFRFNSMALIPLEQELDLIKSYLAIEQVRFGKRLNIVYRIETNANPLIPSLILQPLVENAVKHGVYPKRQGGTVQISIKRVEEETIIIVADDGVGIPPSKLEALLNDKKAQEVGIGLQNINKRLQKHYGYGLNIQSSTDKGTTITLIIPDKRGDYFD